MESRAPANGQEDLSAIVIRCRRAASPTTGSWRSFPPVSYTHLDVYKRQVEARSRALLSPSEVAERFYREAIDRLGRTPLEIELARAHLLYGEWLRRENRRVDARRELRSAHEMFLAAAAHAFAERSSRELLATGEHARKRTVETRFELTAQEAQIARLARDCLLYTSRCV